MVPDVKYPGVDELTEAELDVLIAEAEKNHRFPRREIKKPLHWQGPCQ